MEGAIQVNGRGRYGWTEGGRPEYTIESPSRCSPTHLVENRSSSLSLDPGRAANHIEIYYNLLQYNVGHQNIERSSQSTCVEPI